MRHPRAMLNRLLSFPKKQTEFMKHHVLKLVLAVCVLTGAGTALAQSVYEPYSFTTLAGLAPNPGPNDDTGSLARFNQPWGVAADSAGNVYVADTLNQTIRKITPGGAVTTLAGVAGSPGFADGPASTAQFSRPTGVAVNGAGTVVYVADFNNHLIRQISGGVVSTLAGSVGVSGTNDAIGTAAQFHNPFGVALSGAGTLVYVADMNNQTIRAITVPGGVVTTLAGAPNLAGSVDGANSAARFNTPRGLAVDGSGNLYVADAGNLTVRKILSSGGVSTLAGSVFTPGYTDGLGSAALFSVLNAMMGPFGGPCGVAVDAGGNVYVTDQGNHTVRKITPGGSVTTLAGLALTSGSTDATGSLARFNDPAGVAVDGEGKLYVADAANHTIRVGVTANTNPCANLVVNGSFETTSPVMSPSTYNNALNPTTGVPGWTTASTNSLEVWCNTVTFPASLGTNQLELNAQSADETVSQVVTGLSTHCPATFCFDYTGRFGLVNGTPNNDFTVTLTSGSSLVSLSLDPTAYATGGWVSFSTNFVPTASTMTIAFRGRPHYSDGTIATQGGAHIDNVSLTQCCQTNPCITFTGSTNKTVQCGSAWDFDAPTKIADACCTNFSLSFSTITNGGCPLVITRTWGISDTCGNSNTCSQMVTLRDTQPPAIICPANRIFVALNANCQLEIPTIRPPASDNCTPVSQLVYTQIPLAGTIVAGPSQSVTVTVRDACDHTSQCQVLVCGQDKTPPTLIYPKAVTVANCLVPNVLALVSGYDNCTASNQLVFTQSPLAGTPIAAGGNLVSVTITDLAGNSTTEVIPLTTTGPQSFLNGVFNTAVDSNKVVLGTGAIEPHYTLGPVPVGSPTGPGAYIAPQAVVLSAGWGWPLPPFTVSGWIVPELPYSDTYTAGGSYTYTNQFILPSGASPLAASLSGRWAADGDANMYLNGLTPVNQVSSPITPPGYNHWTYFTLNSGFLAFPAVNQLYFVVTNASGFGYDKFPALRVEFTSAVINCSTCTPPATIQKTLNQSQPLNSTAVFSVSVWGTPPLTLQWYHNGLALANSGHYSGVNTPTLTVTPLSYADAGMYYVAMANPCGASASVPARLIVTKGWGPWPWAWWNFAHIGKPMKATVGPDLSLQGTNIFGISSGTTKEFYLPDIGGQPANVMDVQPLPADTYIQLPLVAPPGSNSVGSYTLLMDFLVPDNSTNPADLFSIFDRWGNLIFSTAPGLAGEMLCLNGMVGDMPVSLFSTAALTLGAWNRGALVVEDDAQAGVAGQTGGGRLIFYLNGKLAGSTPFAGAAPFTSESLATLFSSPAGTTGESYVSGIQFHAVAMTPEIIAGLGDPGNTPLPGNDTSAGASPVLSVNTSNGVANISWTGSAYLLQETFDLSRDPWVDSLLPFEQSEINGNILTTSHAYPPMKERARFFRLIYSP